MSRASEPNFGCMHSANKANFGQRCFSPDKPNILSGACKDGRVVFLVDTFPANEANFVTRLGIAKRTQVRD